MNKIAKSLLAEIERETDIGRIRRKERQAQLMARFAAKDGDKDDESRHYEEARLWRARFFALTPRHV
jgi:hypothetical protein